jgi:hypothetical protein
LFDIKFYCRDLNSDPAELKNRKYLAEKLPEGWSPMDTETQQFTELVPLSTQSNEYLTVSKHFHKTMTKSNYTIESVSRIQNLELWEAFEFKR